MSPELFEELALYHCVRASDIHEELYKLKEPSAYRDALEALWKAHRKRWKELIYSEHNPENVDKYVRPDKNSPAHFLKN